MRAFVCEVDNHGLRRLLPEDLLPAEELARRAVGTSRRPSAVVRALLEERDAEALRNEVAAGRHYHACGLLLNRARELLTISVAELESPGTSGAAR